MIGIDSVVMDRHTGRRPNLVAIAGFVPFASHIVVRPTFTTLKFQRRPRKLVQYLQRREETAVVSMSPGCEDGKHEVWLEG